MARKHLIIGCGSAALSALEKIRSITDEDEIKLVTMDNYLPYSPAVIPYLLAGKAKEADIWLKDEDYFQKMKATLVRNKKVVQVLPDKKQIRYQDGDTDVYDTLLIASGSEPAKPPFKGLEETGVPSFLTLTDYHKLAGMLKDEMQVAILGAGMIAISLAKALLARGIKVTIIGRGRPLRTYFDEESGAYIRDIIVDQGGQIFTGKQITEVKRNGGKFQVVCDDGTIFDADLAVNSVGVQPKVSFLQGSGININTGVVVDNTMKTNLDGIYAAGNVAESDDFFSNMPGVSAILPSAVRQGEIAGANMAGEEAKYEGWIPTNVFHFFDHWACSIGQAMASGKDVQELKDKDDKQKKFKKLVFQEDRLIGATLVNVDADPGIILYLIRKQVNIGPHKELLFNRLKEISRWLMLETERKETLLSATVAEA